MTRVRMNLDESVASDRIIISFDSDRVGVDPPSHLESVLVGEEFRRGRRGVAFGTRVEIADVGLEADEELVLPVRRRRTHIQRCLHPHHILQNTS